MLFRSVWRRNFRVAVVFPARRAQAGARFAAIRSPRTDAPATVSGCVADRKLYVVAPLAAAAVTFTRSLPESSATVIVGAHRSYGLSPAKANAAEQTGIHDHPASSVWDMARLLRYAKSSLGNELAPVSNGTGQVAPSTSREACNFQNFCDPFVRTRSGLTNDPLRFPREVRTQCCHSARLAAAVPLEPFHIHSGR